ncbi:PhnD/SsuA/transferrin family substrate-binding protein [Roseibium sp.]|uniref:PhnD/SsuA/transferrin family substrate-binding protein n=1 Tax=Roseibium sp. TaxID=1936156 RepID=UPI003A96B9A0
MAIALPAKAEQVTVGILAHRGHAVALERWGETFAYLHTQIPGTEFQLLPLTLTGAREALDTGDVDFLLTNPGHFETLSDRYRLSPMVSLRTDRQGIPVTGNRFGSVIFTRSDRTDIKGLSGLKGRTLAAVAPGAFGGFLLASHTLMQSGIDPWEDVRAIQFLGFPQDRIVEAVIRGQADAGTVRTGLLEAMIRDGRIRKGDIRIINQVSIAGFDLMLSTIVVPEWTFAASPDVSEPLRRKVALALLSIGEDHAAAREGRYGGWTTFMHSGNVREVLRSVERRAPAPAGGSGAVIWIGTVIGLSGVAALLLLRGRPRRQADAAAPLDSATAGNALSQENVDKIHLTPREREILGHIENGQTTKEIARQLGISPKTVEYHRTHLMRKFEASNMAEVVHKARLQLDPVPLGPS